MLVANDTMTNINIHDIKHISVWQPFLEAPTVAIGIEPTLVRTSTQYIILESRDYMS